jgi:Fe-S-cluster containining protein
MGSYMHAYIIMEDGIQHRVGEDQVPIDCFRCGICCMLYRPKVTQDEIEQIAEALSLNIKEFALKYVRVIPEKGISILQTDTDRCPFLHIEEKTHQATCTIHSVRPHACRNWQASLSQPECREGLNKLYPAEAILLPQDMYSAAEEMKNLFSALSENSEK